MTDTKDQQDKHAQDNSVQDEHQNEQDNSEPKVSEKPTTSQANAIRPAAPQPTAQNPSPPEEQPDKPNPNQTDAKTNTENIEPDSQIIDESDETENSALENIHVKINFRIGEISMPVNELAALTPGFTLTELPGLIFPRAQAVASGRAFAEGELIEIDGKIGFRITKLLP